MYVTEAKRQVFGICGIDGLAGPSEVLVVADDARATPSSSRARWSRRRSTIRSRASRPCRATARCSKPSPRLLDGPFGRASGRDAIVARVLAERAWLVHAASDDAILE